MDDREWEDSDPRTRPLLPYRAICAKSGTVRELLGLSGEDGSVMFSEHVKTWTPTGKDETKTISLAGWRSFTKQSVLLPVGWKPGDPLPPQRFKLAEEEAKKKREEKAAEDRKRWAAEAEARAASERQMREALERDWQNSEYMLVAAQDGVIDQTHLNHYNQHPRAKNWMARAWSDRRAPGGVGREFLNRVPGNWTCYRIGSLRDGDYIEIGADDISYNGVRTPNRLYFRILATHGSALLLHRLPEVPPLDLEELTLQEERAAFEKWLEARPDIANHFATLKVRASA
jgi:hypothetical protein